jgi:rubrerythrin
LVVYPGLDRNTVDAIIEVQRDELTDHLFYNRLAKSLGDEHNRTVLERIGQEEKEHHDFWKQITGEDVEPRKATLWKYTTISRLFGITFAIKLMERGERDTQAIYQEIAHIIPESKKIAEDENRHEEELIAMIDEERLRYSRLDGARSERCSCRTYRRSCWIHLGVSEFQGGRDGWHDHWHSGIDVDGDIFVSLDAH